MAAALRLGFCEGHAGQQLLPGFVTVGELFCRHPRFSFHFAVVEIATGSDFRMEPLIRESPSRDGHPLSKDCAVVLGRFKLFVYNDL